MLKKRSLLIGLCMLIGLSAMYAQTTDTSPAIPNDKKVRMGKLDNGLTYYVLPNKKPNNRLFMHLVLKTGSLQENDDQQGLAHFCEHMCFNGTKNFEKNELINVLERMGVKFGADLNAYTSFDETVYKLQVATDREGLIDTAFQVLEDWAHNVSFTDNEIDKERGVIHEEWRLGLNANDRMNKILLPVMLKGSRYADRLPIGKMDVIDHCKYDTLRNYYKDWYRPDLAAVIVVGDLSPVIIEQKIKKYFSDWKAIENPKKKQTYEIPDNKEPLIAIATDDEARNYMFSVFYKNKKTQLKTETDFRSVLITHLYNNIINARLKEATQKPSAPFTYASCRYGSFVGTTTSFQAFCVAKEISLIPALRATLMEVERVRQHGFTVGEIEREKKNLITSLVKQLNEEGKKNSSSFIAQYQTHFLDGDAFPDIEWKAKKAQELLKTIKVDELNKLTDKWVTDENIIVTFQGSEKDDVAIPTEKEILDVIKDIKNVKTSPYIDEVSEVPFFNEKLTAGKVVDSTYNAVFDYTMYTFSNGVKAILKETNYKNDEIVVKAVSPGGHSVVSDEDYFNARQTANLIARGGVNNLTYTDLKKVLAGNTTALSPYIDLHLEGLAGNCSPKDIETLLQFNYLYFTKPNKDVETYESFVLGYKETLKNAHLDPAVMFADTLLKTMSSNNPRSIYLPTQKHINSLDYDKILDIYKDRFSDASDFTYTFVGNFKKEELIPLLEKYLGSLPATNRKESWKKQKNNFPKGITNVVLEMGKEPKATVDLKFNGEDKWSYKKMLTYNVLLDVLSIKLREALREDEGGVYGVSCKGQFEKVPLSRYAANIRFGCSPENTDKLCDLVFKTIEEIQKNGPLEDDLNKVKETIIRSRESQVQENQWWLWAITISNNMDIKEDIVKDYEEMVRNISKNDVQKIANEYFDMKNYIKGILLPKEVVEEEK